jgi:magnesium chelatase accessory protein
MSAALPEMRPRADIQMSNPAAGGGSTLEKIETPRVRWHVQRSGAGPAVVLLHGTGAAIHSWRTLTPKLDRDFLVIAPDLPGHGGSEILDPGVISLPAMARELQRLFSVLEVEPALLVGHSAGAALALRMTLDGRARPAGLIAINGAFVPYGGAAGRLLAPLAGLCGSSRLLTGFLARQARDPRAVGRVIASTGSTLDRTALEHYSLTWQDPAHLAATFAMMGNWDLRSLQRDMPALGVPLHLLVADNDGAVDPGQAKRVVELCRTARVTYLAGLGHVAHEEDPDLIARYIVADANRCEVR